jgi:hypothetical protein
MHTNNAIPPELSCGFRPPRKLGSSFLPQMENLDALLAILHSSNLLLSLQGVQQPCEDPSVDSSSKFQNSKSSLLFCACLHTDSNALLAEYLFTEHPTVLSSVHSLHLLNAHLAELHRILSDSDSSELTAEFFPCALLAPTQCPLGRALQNSSELLSATVSSPTQPCLQGIQQP